MIDPCRYSAVCWAIVHGRRNPLEVNHIAKLKPVIKVSRRMLSIIQTIVGFCRVARTRLFSLINTQNRALRTLLARRQSLYNCLPVIFMIYCMYKENLRKIPVWGKFHEPIK
jgi:hypothetical protein